MISFLTNYTRALWVPVIGAFAGFLAFFIFTFEYRFAAGLFVFAVEMLVLFSSLISMNGRNKAKLAMAILASLLLYAIYVVPENGFSIGSDPDSVGNIVGLIIIFLGFCSIQVVAICLLLFHANPGQVIFEPQRFTDVEYAKAELAHIIKPENLSIVSSLLREAQRTRNISFAALAGIGFIVVVAVFFALFAGAITEIDRGGALGLESLEKEVAELKERKLEAFEDTAELEALSKEVESLLKTAHGPEEPGGAAGMTSEGAAVFHTPGAEGATEPPPASTESAKNTVLRELELRSTNALLRFEGTAQQVFASVAAALKLANERHRDFEKEYEARFRLLEDIRRKLHEAQYTPENTTTSTLVSAQITRFGVILVLMFFAQALINLYRYTLRLSSAYKSKAVILALSDGKTTSLEALQKTMSVENVPIGKEPNSPVQDIVKIIEASRRVEGGKVV